MKTLLLLITLFKATACGSPTYVYICDSNSGKKYHLRSDCRGLRTCQYHVVKLTLEEAKRRGKTLCKWEK